MGAVTIHLPKELEKQVRRASASAKMSVSAWMSDAARRLLDERLPPPEFVKLLGTVPKFDLPTRREPWSKEEDGR
jgi:hypothetical protein